NGPKGRPGEPGQCAARHGDPTGGGDRAVHRRAGGAGQHRSLQAHQSAGERDRTIWEVLPYLHERCLDILQPDCCHTGGISQMKKIAALAETYHVPLAPHCTATYLGIAASLHVVASIAHFLIHEFYPDNAGFNPKVLRMTYEL